MKNQSRSQVWGLIAVAVVSVASAGSAFAGPGMPVQPQLRPVVPPPVIHSATPRLGIMGHLQYDWGMVVDAVIPGSTADRMGLERGDKIVRINNRAINSERSYQESLWSAVRFQEGFVTVTVVDVRSGRATQRTGRILLGHGHPRPRFAPQFSTNVGRD